MILGRGSEFRTAPYGAEGILGRGARISLRFIRGYCRVLPPGGARSPRFPTLDAMKLSQGWGAVLHLASLSITFAGRPKVPLRSRSRRGVKSVSP